MNKYKIAVGTDLGRVENKEVTWEDLIKRLTKHKIAKRKGGKYIVGGAFKGENRLEEEMLCRSLLTIDIDSYEGTIDDLEFEIDLVMNCAYVAYSTYQHTSDKPRIRVIAPLNREVSVVEYRALSRSFVDQMGIAVDKCTFTPNTAMYLPSRPEDGETWAAIGEGEHVYVDDYINMKLVEKVDVDVEDDEFFDEKPKLDISIDDIKRALKAYKNDGEGVDYDEWSRVGMGLYHQFDGSDEGYDLWVKWSEQSSKHNERGMRKKYDSFAVAEGRSGDAVTLASVLYGAGGMKAVKRVETTEIVERQVKLVDELCQEISESDQIELRVDICDHIGSLSDDELGSNGREILCKAYQKRMKVLGGGVSIAIKDIRQWLAYRGGEDEVVGVGELVEVDTTWTDDWVYVNASRAYVNVLNMKGLCTEAFNLKCGKWVPSGENGGKMSASKYCGDNGLMKVVDKTMYLPMFDSGVVRANGEEVLNTFDNGSIPDISSVMNKEWTVEGLRAVDTVKSHFRVLCGGDIVMADLLWKYLCHQVQFPGKKIPWSFVIQSIPGMGKTFINELMTLVLGEKNVDLISPNTLMGQYNGYAKGSMFIICEELKITGHNRHDVVNNLKPLITDSFVDIVEKYERRHKVINVTNYIMFTNYRDAMPMVEGDRRFCMVWCPVEELSDEAFKKVGIDCGVTAYFDRLWGALRDNEGIGALWIRRAMMEEEIGEEFMKMKTAPMTKAKEMAIATENSMYEHDDIVKDVIKEGGQYFNTDAISSSDLFDYLLFEHPEFADINTREKNMILKRLGYSQLPKPLKIDGKTRRIWVKNFMDNDQVREKLSR